MNKLEAIEETSVNEEIQLKKALDYDMRYNHNKKQATGIINNDISPSQEKELVAHQRQKSMLYKDSNLVN